MGRRELMPFTSTIPSTTTKCQSYKACCRVLGRNGANVDYACGICGKDPIGVLDII